MAEVASSCIFTPKGIGIAFDAGAVTKATFTGIFSNRQAHFLIGPRYGFYNTCGSGHSLKFYSALPMVR